ncbi:restriction endonuclease [Acidipropionibacterium acidipropionici]|nr:restriction endonuclease [Acidipropionibacterium acidipropionici]
MAPALRVLSDGEIHVLKDIREAAADALNLTPEQRAETIPSGQLRYENRCTWAVSYLKHAAAIEPVSRGKYRITEEGRTLLARHPNGIVEADLEEIAGYDPKSSWGESAPQDSGRQHVPEETELTPDEQIGQAVDQLTAEVAEELLTRLRGNDPDFFERAIVAVLLGMGYGGADKRGKVIGGTGDGGVDGVIDQDALGLDQIYVQAKRYAEGNNVGRETIQAFVGAFQGRNVNRGVFITSSDFTPAARQYADAVSTRIILINGARLADLMVRYHVKGQVIRPSALRDEYSTNGAQLRYQWINSPSKLNEGV